MQTLVFLSNCSVIKGLPRAKFVSLILSRLRGQKPPPAPEEGVSGFGALPKDETMQSHVNRNEELASEAWVSKQLHCLRGILWTLLFLEWKRENGGFLPWAFQGGKGKQRLPLGELASWGTMLEDHRELCVKNCLLLSTSQHPSEAKLEPRERDEALRKYNGLGDSEPMGPLSQSTIHTGCVWHWEARASERGETRGALQPTWVHDPGGHWARQEGKRKSQEGI